MTASLRTFVIANPTSGSGSVKKEWGAIERALSNTLSEYDFAFTEGPGHATLLAREALRAGWEMVVAVGGDGTLNEVVNGYFEKVSGEDVLSLDAQGWLSVKDAGAMVPINPEAVVGVVPMGTGGDFRRTLGLMGGWPEAIASLGRRDVSAIDVGMLGYTEADGGLAVRTFINISSMGMGGLVDRLANDTWKGLGGQASYAAAVVRAFSRWDNVDVELRIDDEEVLRQRLIICILANGQYFGGGMWIAPGATLTDGHLQLQVLGDMTKLEAVRMAPSIYSGTHVKHEKVWRRRVRQVAIRSMQGPLGELGLLDMDGEQPGQLPALWSVMPGALRFKR